MESAAVTSVEQPIAMAVTIKFLNVDLKAYECCEVLNCLACWWTLWQLIWSGAHIRFQGERHMLRKKNVEAKNGIVNGLGGVGN